MLSSLPHKLKSLKASYKRARRRFSAFVKAMIHHRKLRQLKQWLNSWYLADFLLTLGFISWVVGIFLLASFALALPLVGIGIIVYSRFMERDSEEDDNMGGLV